MWTFLDAKTGGEPITKNERVYIRNPICEEDRKQYEIKKRQGQNRVTFMLVVNCLSVVNTGRYQCQIQIPGIGAGRWPSKIAYLTVMGKCIDPVFFRMLFLPHNGNMGLVARKPVFGVSDKANFKPVTSATETS